MSNKSAAIIALVFVVAPIFTIWGLALFNIGPVVNSFFQAGEISKAITIAGMATVGSLLLFNRFYKPVKRMWRALED